MNKVQETDIESYKEIGTLLRVAREQTRMSVDQAARLLHIRMRYLEALEQGRLDELPGLTYTRGYLQAYASFLGLDKEEILRRFEEVENALSRKSIYFPQVFSKEKTPNYWIIWGGLALALLAYIFWAVVLRTPVAKISMVESIRQSPEKINYAGDVACLRVQEVLYPPCTMVWEHRFDLLPMRSQIKSIVDMAITDVPLADPEQ